MAYKSVDAYCAERYAGVVAKNEELEKKILEMVAQEAPPLIPAVTDDAVLGLTEKCKKIRSILSQLRCPMAVSWEDHKYTDQFKPNDFSLCFHPKGEINFDDPDKIYLLRNLTLENLSASTDGILATLLLVYENQGENPERSVATGAGPEKKSPATKKIKKDAQKHS